MTNPTQQYAEALCQRMIDRLMAKQIAQQNAEALAVYQSVMDEPQHPPMSGTCEHIGSIHYTTRTLPAPDSSPTMPARALNRGPQKIGLFTL